MCRAKNQRLLTLNARLALVLNHQVGHRPRLMIRLGLLPIHIRENK